MSEVKSAKAARKAEELNARKERKKVTTYAIIVVAIVAALVIFVALFSSDLFYNKTAAVDVNGDSYSVAEFNYQYFTVYNNIYSQIYSSYGSLASSLLPSGSLREESYMGTDQTWAEYLEDAALQRMENISMLCANAEKDGFTAPEDQLAAIDETIEGLKAQATAGGFASFNSYLVYCYGKGMNEKVLRQCMEKDILATTYSAHVSDSFEYTDDQIHSYYDENKDDYDFLLYRSYFFSGAAVSDDEDTEEDETVTAEAAMAQADTDSKEFLANVTDEQSFMDQAAKFYAAKNGEDAEYDSDESTYRVAQGGSLSDDISAWLLDPARKEGDTTVITTSEDSAAPGCYVLYYLSRDNNQYHAVSGYYALVPNAENVNKDDYDTDEAYEKALDTLTTANARIILEDFTGGSDTSLEGFASFCSENSTEFTESGALTYAGIYGVPEMMRDWLFSSERKEGDTEIFFDPDNGAFIMYYSSDDGIYADLLAESSMRSQDYSDWETEQLESFSAHTQWEMRLSKRITALGG